MVDVNTKLIDTYLELIGKMGHNNKLELISRLSSSMKEDISQERNDKIALLNELSGAWSDMEDGLIEDIFESRTLSDKEINP